VVAEPVAVVAAALRDAVVMRITRKTFVHNAIAKPGDVVTVQADVGERLRAKGLADVVGD